MPRPCQLQVITALVGSWSWSVGTRHVGNVGCRFEVVTMYCSREICHPSSAVEVPFSTSPHLPIITRRSTRYGLALHRRETGEQDGDVWFELSLDLKFHYGYYTGKALCGTGGDRNMMQHSTVFHNALHGAGTRWQLDVDPSSGTTSHPIIQGCVVVNLTLVLILCALHFTGC